MTITFEEPTNAGTADPCNPGDCIPGKNCVPDIECSPANHVALTATLTGNVGNCPPDDHKCQPTDCIPLSVTHRPAGLAMAEPCVPDIPCDPGDIWSCAPAKKSAGFLWLDLTRKCQLECLHCYNASGPDGDHGTMTREDWIRVLDQAIRTGVEKVQLIGGEPTMHPDFADLLSHAVSIGLQVEVYSNLVHVKAEWWELFRQPGVSLATSYYSENPPEHNEITGRDSHRKTRANIARAIGFGIPLRTGIVAMRPTQNIERTTGDLVSLGVLKVGVDRLRRFGRGEGSHPTCDVNELCGNCGDGRAAIGPDGSVTPCIMSSWLRVGNVKTTALAGILAGEEMARATATIPKRVAVDPCDPGAECRPDAYPCQPDA
ncbi:MoaA/NifB/PqqE/SkfB family radical SAM enzyme [Catenulispora sp. GAS73]|uniref:radical SAM protein n=1 Tax=Catenulispora sp. GAS73 TaxID=3156269 RepID=UPI003511F7E4